MSKELDDLTAAVNAMADSVGRAVSQIQVETAQILSLLSAPAGVDPVAVESAAQNISALAGQLGAAVSDATGKVPASAAQ